MVCALMLIIFSDSTLPFQGKWKCIANENACDRIQVNGATEVFVSAEGGRLSVYTWQAPILRCITFDLKAQSELDNQHSFLFGPPSHTLGVIASRRRLELRLQNQMDTVSRNAWENPKIWLTKEDATLKLFLRLRYPDGVKRLSYSLKPAGNEFPELIRWVR